ncbi:MAG TPA: nitroreductase/quinone reductase family protein [Acidimicrobiales bacterium]|nr:nitroreductase/quinone reductase family protein [Acidimicrobiales bacterium]
MPEKDQRMPPYVEPPRDQIPRISRKHVAAMLASDDPAAWGQGGVRHLVLRTVGRRTGRRHDVALPYWEDAEDRKHVVASFAGAPDHPAWFLNLSDRASNPEVWVKEPGTSYWAEAEVLDGEEHDRIWAQLTADRPNYAEYQTRCERRIPLVRLVRRRPG